MTYKFNVTFETITPESAKNGDFETAGFVCKDVPLREAIDELGQGSDGLQGSCYPGAPRWITANRTNEDIGTGEVESRSLHFPSNMTGFSIIRLCRLLDVYGIA